MMTRIAYLADCPKAAEVLAGWHYHEWKDLLPGWTLEHALAELERHTERRQVPTTLIAIELEHVIGSASLLKEDLDGWERLTPWVASVFVAPACRRRGVGRQLINRAVAEAGALGISCVYLWTAGRQEYYRRLGWEPLERAACHGREVLVMQCRTGSEQSV